MYVYVCIFIYIYILIYIYIYIYSNRTSSVYLIVNNFRIYRLPRPPNKNN